MHPEASVTAPHFVLRRLVTDLVARALHLHPHATCRLPPCRLLANEVLTCVTESDLLVLRVGGIVQLTVDRPTQRLVQQLKENFSEQSEIRQGLKGPRRQLSLHSARKN